MPTWILVILDVFFFIFHTAVFLINTFFWMHPKTRRIHLVVITFTAFCWFVLGIWYGLGYCACTDWHWQVKSQLGQTDLPNSFITYLVRLISGREVSDEFVDPYVTYGFFFIVFMTVVLNTRDFLKARKGKK